MRAGWFLLFVSFASAGYTFSWRELWITNDQQAQRLMQHKQFDKAEAMFQQEDWRATAAYRAGHYEQAAKKYQSFQNAQGHYNQGNALAHLGRYEQAINAYDKVLALNPHDQNAIYNRHLLQELLKKDKQQQDQQSKNQQNKDQQGKDQQGEDQQGKDQQGEDQQGKDQQNKDQQNKDQQNKDQQNKDQQNKDQQNKDQQNKDQQGEDQQGKDQQGKDQQGKGQQGQSQKSKAWQSQKETDQMVQEANEKQQAKAQWLRLIPDDPGGLMREKFLRDHMRRQGRWYQ